MARILSLALLSGSAIGLFIATDVSAQNKRFSPTTAGSTFNYNTSGNWDPSGIPGSGDNPQFTNVLSGTGVLVITGSVANTTVNFLRVGSTVGGGANQTNKFIIGNTYTSSFGFINNARGIIEVTNTTLRLGQDANVTFNNDGHLLLKNGSTVFLHAGGGKALVNTGTIILEAVTAGVAINYGQIDNFTNNAGGTFIKTGGNVGSLTGEFGGANRRFYNSGTILIQEGMLYIDPRNAFTDGGFRNQSTGYIQIDAGATGVVNRLATAWDGSGAPVNFGTINLNGGILRTFTATAADSSRSISNASTGRIYGNGTLDYNAINVGVIEARDGELFLRRSTGNAGTWVSTNFGGSESILNFGSIGGSGGQHDLGAGSLLNSNGTVRISGGAAATLSTSYRQNWGTLEFGSGGGQILIANAGSAGSLTNHSFITKIGTSSATLTTGFGVSQNNYSLINLGTISVNGGGTLTLNVGDANAQGGFSNAAPGTLSITDAAGLFQLNRTANAWDNNQSPINMGTIQFTAAGGGGTFSMFSDGSLDATRHLRNLGTIEKVTTGTSGTSTFNGGILNTALGSVIVSNGTLAGLRFTGDNAGLVLIRSTGTLQTGLAAFTNAGSVLLQGGVFAYTNVAGGVTMHNDGTISGSGSIILGFGAGQNNYSFVNSGSLLATGGTLTFRPDDAFANGGFRNAAGGTAEVAAASWLVIRRTDNAWNNGGAQFPTNSGVVLLSGGTLRGENISGGLANRLVNDSTGRIQGSGTLADNFNQLHNDGHIHANSVTPLNLAALYLHNRATGTITNTGGRLNFLSGTVTTNLGIIATLGGGITTNAGTLVIGANGTQGTLSGNLANTGDLLFHRSDAVTYNDVISGSGVLIKRGTDTLTLAGVNTYTGNTEIDAGTLRIDSGGDLTASSKIYIGNGLNSSDATLELAGAVDVDRPIQVNTSAGGGARAIDVTAASGTAVLGGTIDLARVLTINANSGGSLTIAGAINLDHSGANNLTNNTTGYITINGAIAGTGRVLKRGTGTLTLGSTGNSYTGNTEIDEGTLAVTGDIANGSSIFIGNGLAGFSSANATLTLGANGVDLGGTVQANVAATGGTGQRTINSTATSGNTTISGNVTVNSNVTLRAESGSKLNLTGNVTINNSRSVIAEVGTTGGSGLEIAGAISGASATVVKNGAGVLTFSGGTGNSYSGATTVNAGRLDLNKSSGNAIAGALTIGDGTGGVNADLVRLLAGDQISDSAAVTINSSGQLNLNGFNDTILSLGGSGNVALGGGNLTVANTSLASFGGAITGAGNLIKQGANVQVLSGANSYNGATTVNAGTLRVGANDALPTGTAVTLANTAGAVLDLDGNLQQIASLAGGGATGGNVTLGAGELTINQSANTTYAGIISGIGGSVIKSGSGNVTLSGNNTYSGGTTLTAGRLSLSGTLASGVAVNGGILQGTGRINGTISGTGGRVSPGNSPGILTAAQFDPTGGVDYSFEFTQLGDPTWNNAGASGNDVQRLTHATTPFTANLTLANSLDVYLNAGSLGVGDIFRGGFYTDRNSDFTTLVNGAAYNFFVADAGGNVTFNSQNYYSLANWAALNYTPVNPGFSLGIVRSVAQVPSANFTGGTINNGWVQQFEVLETPLSSVVPEPSIAILMLVGGGMLYARRRQRRR